MRARRKKLRESASKPLQSLARVNLRAGAQEARQIESGGVLRDAVAYNSAAAQSSSRQLSRCKAARASLLPGLTDTARW
jgi:hypothetical protein